MKRLFSTILCLALGVSLSSAKTSKDDMKLPIRDIMAKYYDADQFVLGASGRMNYISAPDKIYERWLEEFSYNTPENSFKLEQAYRQPGEAWKNQGYMRFIEIARENGQIIRSHGPISPQCSAWSKEDNRTAEELDELMTYYMTRLSMDLQDNHDVVKWMDVVNETFAGSNLMGIGYDAALSEDTFLYNADDWFGPRKGTNQWENPWPLMGFDAPVIDGEVFVIPKYIEKAFRIADKYAPDVKLIYNDHGKSINPKIYIKLKKTVEYLRSIGCRVDGIGWQGHVNLGWEKDPQRVQDLRDVIAWCHENDLEFHVTELDVTVGSGLKGKERAKKLAKTRDEQAQTLCAVLEVMLQNIGKGARGLNYWTMSDHQGGALTFGVLFDEQGKPTPAYYKTKELLIKYGKK